MVVPNARKYDRFLHKCCHTIPSSMHLTMGPTISSLAVQETERRSIPVWEKALKWILGTWQVGTLFIHQQGPWRPFCWVRMEISCDSNHTLFTKFESLSYETGCQSKKLIFYKIFNVSWSSSCATQQIKRTRSYIQILEGVWRKLCRSFCDCFIQISEKLSKCSTTQSRPPLQIHEKQSLSVTQGACARFPPSHEYLLRNMSSGNECPLNHATLRWTTMLLAELMFTCCAFNDSSDATRSSKFFMTLPKKNDWKGQRFKPYLSIDVSMFQITSPKPIKSQVQRSHRHHHHHAVWAYLGSNTFFISR